MTTVAT
ncbi:hypothetical protein YPPY10_1612, partial [Yersinia pestis PY-10]